MSNINRRLRSEKIAKILMQISGISITGSLFLIIGIILYKGLPYISWEMISQSPQGGFYMKHGKKYVESAKLVENGKFYEVGEACD